MLKAFGLGRAFLVPACKKPSAGGRASLSQMDATGADRFGYFGGAGVKISRLLGSGFGLGFGAFLASFLPLSLLPMPQSMTQIGTAEKRESTKTYSAYDCGYGRHSLPVGRTLRILDRDARIH